MTFWIISGLVALATALLIGWPLVRPRRASDDAAEDLDIQIYRDQLQAVEKDVARGVVTEDDAERLRTEIKRRILDADKTRAGAAGRAPRELNIGVAAVAGIAIIAGSYLVYDLVGAPGYEDLPLKKRLALAERARAERPSQASLEAQMPPSPTPAPEVSPEYADLIEQLRAAVEKNPDELQGWELLARNEARLGNLSAAHAAQAKIVELKGPEAAPQDYLALAALMIQAAGGNVSAEADAALTSALERDPHNPVARYYMGLAHLQTGRPDLTFEVWEPLLRDSPPDAPWVPVIRARLESVAAIAGIHYTPQAPRTAGPFSGGPSADDMAAAAEMSPEERQAFIQNMVDQLSARLSEEGGPPEDWAKLIRAHGVLGDTESATAAWEQAQAAYPDPSDLEPVRQAAAMAGVEGVSALERGPTQDDINAAAEMAPEDRQEMIRNMVDQLGERLATEGGPPSDWAQLVRAHGVLGNTDRAAAIWAEAQQTFGSRPEALETIRQAAVDAGVAE
ncbi:c-type cytochrome biogenesis protein CcmI [Tropicimonas isoalkanivorans]|uniref:Cytochrome c-type biogenesis protein CcmH n=1 Tax=Tropicimonas isoalkanivorans TaxID=441112 RepID=A0A1I1G2G3_9RHOB|nr:c-type cytochrome biogenesis protein CcmI [Tropicimonas isoalkanivorans]SFC05516.1 cytochrome c-type biogenesis protein CcmH [Tropicimonas isoalkanivorans]